MRFLYTVRYFALFIAFPLSLMGQKCGNAQDYFSPIVKPGQQINNLFSRTISYRPIKPDSFQEIVVRDSSTVAYTILGLKPDGIELKFNYRSDGIADSTAIKGNIRQQGRSWCGADDKCNEMTDASGLLYNSAIWGNKTGAIQVGDSWDVTIPVPWEFGASGSVQKVTVQSCDSVNKMIRLKREGSSNGAFALDRKELSITKDGKKYHASIIPGHAEWSGYTIFQKGVIISDELLVRRSDLVKVDEFGEIPTEERQYMLLNLMPEDAFSAK